MITIPRESCIDWDEALKKEWLVANGIGGYASGTITGANTRRYHGLLVAALNPPVERTILLAKLDEEVEIDGRTFYLGANEYPDEKIHPGGYVHIEEFSLRLGIPSTLYRVGDSALIKTVWMEYGQNTTYVRYTYAEGDAECRLTLTPMCNYRDYHATTRGERDWDFGVEPMEGGCKITALQDAVPYWLTTHPRTECTLTGVWYWNFVYRAEVERGFEGREDLYVPGVLRCTLQPGESLTLIASTEPPDVTAAAVEGALGREQARARALLEEAGFESEAWEADAADPEAQPEAFAAQLALAADSFTVTRNLTREGEKTPIPTVIAGYHWFTDWGRDTMISIPGLALPTGRTREASRVLRAFGQFARDGLIPNNFPDVGTAPHYNTADATLWMFAATEAIAIGTGKINIAKDLYPLLSDIVAHHVAGTHYGIGVDPADGLLRAGEEGVQLTWMDAKVDGWVVTPRIGKPVEINALWYNALRVMDRLRVSLGRTVPSGHMETPDFSALAEQVRDSFRKRFWYDAGGYLFDVVDGPDGPDVSLRPNQIFALSLESDLLGADQARDVLAVVRKHLLTPYGLRTLAPGDARYAGIYEGKVRERDAAYHNGTVWAWLLGHYLDAVRAVEGVTAARADLMRLLPYLRQHLTGAGLGSVSEIFDADPPHAPKGCVAQAWSVAEILRHVWGPDSLL
jgi:predicted glycogen debranching enzyme